jgi:predicted Holliday junction resolvase-like endonuclease
MIGVYAVLILIAICVILVVVICIQAKVCKKAKQENASLREAFLQVQNRAERLQKALGGIAKLEENANAERQELNRTPDADLVNRANGLFGVRNNEKHQQ